MKIILYFALFFDLFILAVTLVTGYITLQDVLTNPMYGVVFAYFAIPLIIFSSLYKVLVLYVFSRITYTAFWMYLVSSATWFVMLFYLIPDSNNYFIWRVSTTVVMFILHASMTYKVLKMEAD